MFLKKEKMVVLIIFFLILIFIFFYKIFNDSNKLELNSDVNLSNKKDEINLIEGIEYFSKDNNQNSYLIKAMNGSIDSNNPNLITLNKVNASLNFDMLENIYVFSDSAIYNTLNHDTKFFNNVRLSYKDHQITTNILNVEFSKNLANFSDNVYYKNKDDKIFADQIDVDLLKRTTKIYMFDIKDKVKIYSNYGGN